MKDKLNCEIVRDLLPLYHDNVVSDATRTAVEEHLADCTACSEELKTLDEQLLPDEKKKKSGGFKNAAKKLKKKALIKGVCVAAALCVLVGGLAYFLTDVNIKPIATDAFWLTDAVVYDMKDMDINSGDMPDKTKGIYLRYNIANAEQGCGMSMDWSISDDGKTLELSLKRPLVRTVDFDGVECNNYWTIQLTDKQTEGLENVSLNGKDIGKVGKGDVPDYVTMQLEQDYNRGGSISFFDQQCFGIFSDDRKTVTVWNNEGEKVYEGPTEDFPNGLCGHWIDGGEFEE